MSRRPSFTQALVGAALLAMAIRALYALSMRGYPVQGDALTFHLVGQGLADGKGFVAAFPPGGPTAEHPPMMELLLAGLDRLGANGYQVHRLVLGAIGTVNVVLVGLLGRAVGGARTGILAGLVAAVYPLLWTADGALMSEPLYGTFLLAALLSAVRLRRAPAPRTAALLGALLGLAALTRGEAIELVVLLAVPVVLGSTAGGRARVALVGAVLAAFVVVLAPWTIRNLQRFDTPVLISTNADNIFAGANCRDTYYGPLVGAWRLQCFGRRRSGEDEATYFRRERDAGLRYARGHTDRVPAVVAARLGRVLDVFRVDQAIFFNASEGRRAQWARRGIWLYWVVGLLALAGLGVLARRRSDVLLVLLAPVAMVLATAAVTYGTTRFRYAAEPTLIVLAAVALTTASERRWPRRGPPAGPPA